MMCVTQRMPFSIITDTEMSWYQSHYYSSRSILLSLDLQLTNDLSRTDRHSNPDVIINDADRIPTPTAILISSWCSIVTGIVIHSPNFVGVGWLIVRIVLHRSSVRMDSCDGLSRKSTRENMTNLLWISTIPHGSLSSSGWDPNTRYFWRPNPVPALEHLEYRYGSPLFDISNAGR